ncbi:MAG: hypothetical protein ACREYA_30770 [Cupriavidus necator]
MKPEDHAVALCECYSAIPGIRRPYEAGLFTWKRQRYCHVSGLGDDGHRHLVEVFVLHDGMDPEPVLAYQYPPPIAQYFPAEYQLLFDKAIATEKVAPVPVGVSADSLKQFSRSVVNVRHRPDQASLPAEPSLVAGFRDMRRAASPAGKRRTLSASDAAPQDDEQTAKGNVYAAWLSWQVEPQRYTSLTAFARAMLLLHDSLSSPAIVRRWCRAWQRGLAIPVHDVATNPCASDPPNGGMRLQARSR